MTSRALSAFQRPLETEMKKPLSEEPIDAFATNATIAMRDPIIAYSMTVTPDASLA
jgi:hypothetical protein